MFTICDSVGIGGRNNPQDVMIVQQLLNRHIPESRRLLPVDGQIGSRTLSEIELFQFAYSLVPPWCPAAVETRALGLSLDDSLHACTVDTADATGHISAFGRTAEVLGARHCDTIAWGADVSKAFKSKVVAICERLKISVDFLMAAMAFETGETFSPSKENTQSGATGLIQFISSTASGLGTSIDKLKTMTAEDQLDYVGKHFESRAGRLHTLSDVYMAILWPKAAGKGEDETLFQKGTKAYEQNKGLDTNKDDRVTAGEAAAVVRKRYAKGVSAAHLG